MNAATILDKFPNALFSEAIDMNWVSEKEFANELGVHRVTLNRARRSGRPLLGRTLPRYYRVGRFVRFRREDVDLWIDKAMEGPGFRSIDDERRSNGPVQENDSE